MFIGAEIPLTVCFNHALARLAKLIRDGSLELASGGAYAYWSTALARPRTEVAVHGRISTSR